MLPRLSPCMKIRIHPKRAMGINERVGGFLDIFEIPFNTPHQLHTHAFLLREHTHARDEWYVLGHPLYLERTLPCRFGKRTIQQQIWAMARKGADRALLCNDELFRDTPQKQRELELYYSNSGHAGVMASRASRLANGTKYFLHGEPSKAVAA
jgi:hypothetical protein